jgi:hypothetical protein
VHASQFVGAELFITRTGTLDADQTAVPGIPDDWESIGAVNDILLAEDGMTKALLADIGGFLGVDAKTVAVPLEALRILKNTGPGAGGALVGLIESSRQELESAPTFADLPQGDAAAAKLAEPLTAPDIRRPGYSSVPLGAIAAEDLRWAPVYDVNDDTLGEVRALELAEDDTIGLAILDVGSSLGLGAKRIAVGADGLTILRDDSGRDIRVYIDADEERLGALPEYEG